MKSGENYEVGGSGWYIMKELLGVRVRLYRC